MSLGRGFVDNMTVENLKGVLTVDICPDQLNCKLHFTLHFTLMIKTLFLRF